MLSLLKIVTLGLATFSPLLLLAIATYKGMLNPSSPMTGIWLLLTLLVQLCVSLATVTIVVRKPGLPLWSSSRYL